MSGFITFMLVLLCIAIILIGFKENKNQDKMVGTLGLIILYVISIITENLN